MRRKATDQLNARMKRNLLVEYARHFGLTNFVETGTYKGETVKAMVKSRLFTQIHTVDIYIDRVEACAKRFINNNTVHCWEGDSGTLMPEILQWLKAPTLFWLDAHHSGKKIARKKGLIETPIVKELEAVVASPWAKTSVILIDDARYYEEFSKKYTDYPSTDYIRVVVKEKLPDFMFEVEDDIIRIYDGDYQRQESSQ